MNALQYMLCNHKTLSDNIELMPFLLRNLFLCFNIRDSNEMPDFDFFLKSSTYIIGLSTCLRKSLSFHVLGMNGLYQIRTSSNLIYNFLLSAFICLVVVTPFFTRPKYIAGHTVGYYIK